MDKEQFKRMLSDLIDSLSLSSEKEKIAGRYLKRVVDKILIYCNRDDLPEAVESTVVEIAEDMMKADGITSSEKEVASITRGDTSISYKDGGIKSEKAVGFMKNYESTLNRFRKMNLPKG